MTLVFRRLAAVLLLAAGALLTGPDAQAQTLRIFSATDTPAMQPLLDAFEERTPGVNVDYVEFQTLSLY